MPLSSLRREGFADNNGVKIHYIELIPGAAKEPPLILVPGMALSADFMVDDLVPPFNRHCIVMSIRGRGRSDAPLKGYSLRDQISDIGAVVRHLSLERFDLYGHSIGAVFALGYTLEEMQRYLH